MPKLVFFSLRQGLGRLKKGTKEGFCLDICTLRKIVKIDVSLFDSSNYIKIGDF